MATLGVPSFQATPCPVDSSFILNDRPRNLTFKESVNCSTGLVAVLVLVPLEVFPYVLPGPFLACKVKVADGLIPAVVPLKLKSGISC